MTNLKSIALTLILQLVFLISFGQTVEEQINSIITKVNAVDTVSSYKIIQLKNQEFLGNAPKGGAKLTGNFQNDRLIKSASTIVTSYGIQLIEFYYSNNTLLFAHVKESDFKNSKTDDTTDTEVVLNGYYYYDSNKQIISRRITGHGYWEKTNDIMLRFYSDGYAKMLYKKYNAS